MRLFHQIFLLVGLSAIAAAILMAGFTSLSLSRGFEAYLDDRDAQRLAEFVAEAEAAIADQPDRGLELAAVLLPDPRPDRPPRQIGDAAAGQADPPTRSGPEGRPLPPPGFLPRLSIYRADGSRVAGPPILPNNQSPMRRPIRSAGQTIGEAVLLPRGPAPEGLETDFLRAQLSGIAALLAFIIGVAGAAAFFIARRGAAALEDIEFVASNVASGDFSKRASVRGKGEIAALAENVNRMSSKLGELQQARRTWLAEVGHELRTPLTVIQGEIEALREGIRPLNQKAILSLGEEANRLSLLVDDLQFLALSDMSRPSFSYTQVLLAPLLDATLDRFAPLAEAANHRFTIEHSIPATMVAHWDKARVEQLLANLISNAIAYTKAPGRIVLTAALTGSDIEILVEDSAPGVDPGDLGQLFDPLFRAEKSRARHLGGSGLGLSVCSVIASGHQGSIGATHSEMGGLRVTVRLPLKSDQSASQGVAHG